jgi:hypothetical protein
VSVLMLERRVSLLVIIAKTTNPKSTTANNCGANVKISGIRVNNVLFLQPKVVMIAMNGLD